MLRQEIIQRISSHTNYFFNNISNNILFEPEFEGFRKVLEIISTNKVLTKDDLFLIVKILNEVVDRPHYKGSGWQDAQMSVISILKDHGLEAQIDKSGYIQCEPSRLS